MATPRVLILRAPGTNCDGELAFAFERAGAIVEKLHIARLRERPRLLQDYEILAIPGGFTYGDDVAAGKILAVQLSTYFGEALRKFRDAEKLVIGVCNGFQALLKAGLLIPPDEDGPLATLTNNTQGRFENRWVTLRVSSDKSPWLTGLEQLYVPIAHGEGRFIARANWILEGLRQAGQVVLQYAGPDGEPSDEFPFNPNGSQGAVAGMCDATGRVLGLMPHPERHVLGTHHPRWTREGLKEEGDGMAIFRNAVAYFGE
ncbi:MAG: phosphoribosylformylglycinamidine synthase subunit PurQ [Gemmataceae bacterium]